MKQEGYTLLLCLVVITLLSMLSLAFMEQSRWRQRLVVLLLASDQQDIRVKMAVANFHSQSRDFSHDACILDWQQSDEGFDRLKNCEPCCLLNQGKVQIRYMIISNTVNEPQQLMLIARANNNERWYQFQFQFQFQFEL
jgi:hypothetical protein